MRELFDRLLAEGEVGIDRLVAEATQESVTLDFKEARGAETGTLANEDRTNTRNSATAWRPTRRSFTANAVHPTHQTRPAGVWMLRGADIAVPAASGRDRMNIHGVIDLETGMTRMKEVLSVDADSTIALLLSIETAYPTMRRIHVYLDNARYHHARAVQAWMKQPGRRVVLHFIPSYCPHLNPIERLWGVMHENVTHNRFYATFRAFSEAVLTFLTETVLRKFDHFSSRITDNFRVRDPRNFRVLAS